MIRNDQEYQASVRKLREQDDLLKQQALQLKNASLSRDEIKRVQAPLRSFREQIKDEITSYKRLKRGEFEELKNFSGIGRLLVALRIAKGVTQRELARRIGVNESQVSRDERNEYHNITVERANRILSALGVEIATSVVSLKPKRGKALAHR